LICEFAFGAGGMKLFTLTGPDGTFLLIELATPFALSPRLRQGACQRRG
jgi:hypothetical protein